MVNILLLHNIEGDEMIKSRYNNNCKDIETKLAELKYCVIQGAADIINFAAERSGPEIAKGLKEIKIDEICVNFILEVCRAMGNKYLELHIPNDIVMSELPKEISVINSMSNFVRIMALAEILFRPDIKKDRDQINEAQRVVDVSVYETVICLTDYISLLKEEDYAESGNNGN